MSTVPPSQPATTVSPLGSGLPQAAPETRPLGQFARSVGMQPNAGARNVDETHEYFHALLRSLPWPGNGLGRRIRTVGMTSCYRGEGVSTVATHTAISAAGSGNYNVLLVDANLGRPALHTAFDLPLEPGLAEVLCRGAQFSSAIRPTRHGSLSVLSAGSADIGGVYEAPDRVNALLGDLKKDFDLVVFDMPAAGQVPSSLEWLRLFDSVVLVLEDERVRWQVGQRMAKSLRRAGANLAGVAFNRRQKHIPNWLYKTL